MKKTNPETLNQPMAEAPLEDKEQKNAEQTDGCELDDDLLEGVSGGLVQLVNPSSSRL